jgi:spermidine/putrescine-binding protein
MSSALHLLTWPDYISPKTIEQFERRSGLSVRVETVPSAVELLERMRADDAGVDILCPPDYAVRELNGEKRLLALNHDALPNLRHLQPRFLRGRAHDPESLVSAVKDWGTTGFMLRTDKISETPAAWADFWSLAEKYSGRVSVLDSPGEVIGAALKMRGHSYNAADEKALAQAERDLMALKPHLKCFETNYRPLVQSGDAYLALGWNGDAASLQAAGAPVQYVVPAEGSQMWEDDWAIAAATHHPGEAHTFLNFVLAPEIAAQEAGYTGYATGNAGALALLPPEVRSNPSIYPPDHVLAKLESGMPLSDAEDKRRAALWAKIRL